MAAAKKIKVELLEGFVKYNGKTYKKGDTFEIAEKDFVDPVKRVLKEIK